MEKEISTAGICWVGQLCRSREKYGLLGSLCDILKEGGTICASFTQPAFRGFVRPCNPPQLQEVYSSPSVTSLPGPALP